MFPVLPDPSGNVEPRTTYGGPTGVTRGTDRKRHGTTIRKISRDYFGATTILLTRRFVNDFTRIPPE